MYNNNFAAARGNFLQVSNAYGKQGNAATYNLSPILTGDNVAELLLHSHDVVTASPNLQLPKGNFSLQDLLDNGKPLVFAFWPILNKVEDISVWESLQADVHVMGGELIIFTNASASYFTHKIRRSQSLNIITDVDNAVAEKFGLFDRFNSLSDWLSGIEDNIALPAFYVVGQDRKIKTHYIDYSLKTLSSDFLEFSFVRKLLTQVYYQASLTAHNLGDYGVAL